MRSRPRACESTWPSAKPSCDLFKPQPASCRSSVTTTSGTTDTAIPIVCGDARSRGWRGSFRCATPSTLWSTIDRTGCATRPKKPWPCSAPAQEPSGIQRWWRSLRARSRASSASARPEVPLSNLIAALSTITTVAFVLLGAAVAVGWLRRRARSLGWLALAIGLLALVSLAGTASTLLYSIFHFRSLILSDLNLVAFVASAYALLRYRASFIPVSRVWHGIVAAAMVLGTIAYY